MNSFSKCGLCAVVAMLLLPAAAPRMGYSQQESPPASEPRLRPTIGKAPGPSARPGEFTVSIEGAKQGRFKGEGAESAKDKIIGLSYQSEVRLPRDANGVASGKRQHLPLTILKQWGAASPQLFQAMATGEALKNVTMEFYRQNSQGTNEVFYVIKLSGATVAGIRQFTENERYFEEISLNYMKIEVEHKPSSTSASDDVK